jgi:putative GTP pyrophosphokinase
MKSSKQSPTIDLQTVEYEYQSLRVLAEPFCKEMANQLRILLEGNGLTLGSPIQQRVKEWASIAEKLQRLNRSFGRISDMQDIVGIRTILLFKRDAVKACELISATFRVINQYDTAERLKADQFGYSSTHFIVEIPEQWLTLPSFARMRGMKAEVQVRSLAQHIWAEASHTLQYKQKSSVPHTVLRGINRVSALLETVDLEFERVLAERDLYRNSIAGVTSDDVLNVDLLEKTLDSVLPPDNKDQDEEYADLLAQLK